MLQGLTKGGQCFEIVAFICVYMDTYGHDQFLGKDAAKYLA